MIILVKIDLIVITSMSRTLAVRRNFVILTYLLSTSCLESKAGLRELKN